jgi:hypothetical protein
LAEAGLLAEGQSVRIDQPCSRGIDADPAEHTGK